MPLEDYKDLVASAAGITTIAQLFSPGFLCKKILQNGSTKGSDPMPFIGGMVLTSLFLQYGLILKDEAMIPVNLFGFVLNLAYTTCYYLYSSGEEKVLFFSALGKGAALTAVVIGYAQWESEDLVEYRFGMIVTVLMLSLIGAPLLSLGEIIKKKNVASLPFPMIISGTVVSFLWLLYGIIIKNIFMQVQNSIALGLSAVQLSLFAIYPSTPLPGEAGDSKKKK